jgi:hypothetical protein
MKTCDEALRAIGDAMKGLQLEEILRSKDHLHKYLKIGLFKGLGPFSEFAAAHVATGTGIAAAAMSAAVLGASPDLIAKLLYDDCEECDSHSAFEHGFARALLLRVQSNYRKGALLVESEELRGLSGEALLHALVDCVCQDAGKEGDDAIGAARGRLVPIEKAQRPRRVAVRRRKAT